MIASSTTPTAKKAWNQVQVPGLATIKASEYAETSAESDGECKENNKIRINIYFMRHLFGSFKINNYLCKQKEQILFIHRLHQIAK